MKKTEINCDICGVLCEFKRGYANFVYTDMQLDGEGVLRPVVANEDYCSECAEKLKKSLKEIKCQEEKER